MGIRIIHHVKNNTLGVLEGVLSRRNLVFDYVFCQDLSPALVDLADKPQGIVLLGGMESVADEQEHAFMATEMQMIRHAMASGVPVFGICLGAQLMARSLGAVVEKNRVNGTETKEIGWTALELTPEGQRDPVLSPLAGTAQFQWHEDTYQLPAEATHLATTPLCAQQAFRVENTTAPAYGVQFHPEVNLPIIRAWLAASKTLVPECAQTIWRESEQTFAQRSAASLAMFEAFCDLAF
jgi:GMP synthase (glutamine-hydrolysing)